MPRKKIGKRCNRTTLPTFRGNHRVGKIVSSASRCPRRRFCPLILRKRKAPMPLRTVCPHCDRKATFQDIMEGKTVKCVDCKEPFVVTADVKRGGSRVGSRKPDKNPCMRPSIG